MDLFNLAFQSRQFFFGSVAAVLVASKNADQKEHQVTWETGTVAQIHGCVKTPVRMHSRQKQFRKFQLSGMGGSRPAWRVNFLNSRPKTYEKLHFSCRGGSYRHLSLYMTHYSM